VIKLKPEKNIVLENPLNCKIKRRWIYPLKIQYLIEALKVYFDYHRRTVFLTKKGTFTMDNIVRTLEHIELTEGELELADVQLEFIYGAQGTIGGTISGGTLTGGTLAPGGSVSTTGNYNFSASNGTATFSLQ
jgi:hypothetical protein